MSILAGWQSGYATACKAVYAGSIPAASRDYEKIVITGAAGFIGFHLSKEFISKGYLVIGIDNLNEYYDKALKEYRLRALNNENFIFHEASIHDFESLKDIFIKHSPEIVVNLAAQAGVRYSLQNPNSYIDSNIIGFHNLLECCRLTSPQELFMLQVAPYMEIIEKFLSPKVILPIKQFLYTRRQKKQMSN